MNSAASDYEELTQERTFWDLRKVTAELPRKWFYRFWVVETVVASAASAAAYVGKLSDEIVVQLLAKLMEQGFAVAVQILAFGLAGLAIYAAALVSDLAKVMADTPYSANGKLSTLKGNALAFARVFMPCFAMIALYFVWLVFFPVGGLPYQFAHFLVRDGRAWDLVLAVSLGACVLLVAHLLVAVQLFLFDLHHIVMTFARGKVMMDSRRQQTSQRN